MRALAEHWPHMVEHCIALIGRLTFPAKDEVSAICGLMFDEVFRFFSSQISDTRMCSRGNRRYSFEDVILSSELAKDKSDGYVFNASVLRHRD